MFTINKKHHLTYVTFSTKKSYVTFHIVSNSFGVSSHLCVTRICPPVGRDLLYLCSRFLFFRYFCGLYFRFAFARDMYNNDFCFRKKFK